MFPVYARGIVYGTPLFWVSKQQARELLSNGSAKSINSRSAIQLLLNLEQFRGVSAQMGPSVTVKAMLGSLFHQECAQSYLMLRPGSYCPLIPR
jgi:hypothetical protein